MKRYCDNRSRRHFLQVGLGAAGGCGLASLLWARAAHAANGKRPNNCIFFWMDGGPSHYETFDPKPGAPAEIRGLFQPIQTRVPGVLFSEHVPRIAQVMDKITIVRTITHNDAAHGGGNHYLTTGYPTPTPGAEGDTISFHPSYGSVIARERPSTNGLPAYLQFALPGPLKSGGPNFLGARYAPFLIASDPNRPDFKVSDVTLPRGVSEGRSQSREALRQSLDNLQRIQEAAAADPARGLDGFRDRALGLVTSRQARDAFDIQREPRATRDAYGRTMVGQMTLMARRLVEAGVPFVTVQHAGWDHHGDIFPLLKDRFLPIFDRAFSALIRDLDERGLLDTTLVMALGEFGRTPKINENKGRDHWPGTMSVIFAGAGVPRGHVIGATDAQGTMPVDRPVRPEDLAATLFTKLGIDPHKEYTTPLGRPVPICNGGEAIHELF